MKLKYLVMSVLAATSLYSAAERVNLYKTSTGLLDCGGCETFAGKGGGPNGSSATPPMQVQIAWLNGDGAPPSAGSPPPAPPNPPAPQSLPKPPESPSGPPAGEQGNGAPPSGGGGGSGGSGGSGGGGGGGAGGPPPAGPQPEPPPGPVGEPKLEEVLLDVIFPTDDQTQDPPPTFTEAAFEDPPRGTDAVINAVPEPGPLGLLGIAMAGLVGIQRRKTRR